MYTIVVFMVIAILCFLIIHIDFKTPTKPLSSKSGSGLELIHIKRASCNNIAYVFSPHGNLDEVLISNLCNTTKSNDSIAKDRFHYYNRLQ